MTSDFAISNDDLLFAMQQRNLVYNYNFLYYSNTKIDTVVTYNHPDGWVYADSGSNGIIGFDPTSNACVIVTSSGANLMTFTQTINEFPRWRNLIPGNKVSASAIVKVPGAVSCEITFSLTDGKNTSSRTEFFNAGEQKEIPVSLDVGQDAGTLRVSIECSASQITLYVYSICANVGATALGNLPCIVDGIIGERKQYVSTQISPASELSLCTQMLELSASYTRLNSVLNGKFGIGPGGNSYLPDMRGYFSRAWDNGSGVDPDANYRTALGKGTTTGDKVGTVEIDQFKQHTHQLQFNLNGQVLAGNLAATPVINKITSSQTDQTGGAETRSKNISELYTIKWA